MFKIKDHQPRTDDLMDTIENSILENRTLRIEHRWLEIERIRSLAYWYPFYARSSMGETSDDCCDPDRLIAYEDDIEPFLVDLNPLLKSPLDTSIYEGFKFKLLVGLLKIFRLVSVDDESLDLHSTHAKLIHSNNLIADDTFLGTKKSLSEYIYFYHSSVHIVTFRFHMPDMFVYERLPAKNERDAILGNKFVFRCANTQLI